VCEMCEFGHVSRPDRRGRGDSKLGSRTREEIPQRFNNKISGEKCLILLTFSLAKMRCKKVVLKQL
jgi:hypothetical protein